MSIIDQKIKSTDQNRPTEGDWSKIRRDLINVGLDPITLQKISKALTDQNQSTNPSNGWFAIFHGWGRFEHLLN